MVRTIKGKKQGALIGKKKEKLCWLKGGLVEGASHRRPPRKRQRRGKGALDLLRNKVGGEVYTKMGGWSRGSRTITIMLNSMGWARTENPNYSISNGGTPLPGFKHRR